MKNKLLTLVFIAFFYYSNSQEKFSIGLNSGVTHSKLTSTYFFKKYKYDTDFLVGLSSGYKLKNNMSLALNINYDRKSSFFYYEKSSYTVIGTPIGETPKPAEKFKFKTRIESISIPIMFKYHFGFSYDFFFSGGSSLDYLLNIKNIDDGNESDLDFDNNFKKASYNLVLGFGYGFKMNNNDYISLEIRENFRITDMDNGSNPNFDDTKSNSLNLIFNYSFNI